jgi:hypothetical protein
MEAEAEAGSCMATWEKIVFNPKCVDKDVVDLRERYKRQGASIQLKRLR